MNWEESRPKCLQRDYKLQELKQKDFIIKISCFKYLMIYKSSMSRFRNKKSIVRKLQFNMNSKNKIPKRL